MKFCASNFLLKLRKCNGDHAAILTLSHWCEQVSLLVLQSHGNALMKRLIDTVKSQFSDVLNAAAEINSERNKNQNSEWIYQKVLGVYKWLNCLEGVPDSLIEKRWQEWEPESSDSSASCITQNWLIIGCQQYLAEFQLVDE